MVIKWVEPIKDCFRAADTDHRGTGRRNVKKLGLNRPGATFVALFFAFASLLVLAPSAYAQVDVGEATNTAKDATDPVEDTAVDEATDGVTGAREDGPIKETVDTVTKEVDEVTGGASQPVTDQVRKISDETLRPVDDAIGDTLGGIRSGNDPQIGSGETDGALSRTNQRDASAGQTSRVRGTRFGRDTTGSEPVSDELIRPISDRDISTDESAAERARRIAEEIAFPLILLLMVAAFLVIQGRLDKKDPKLALAPRDIDEQYLSFR